jgi:hypothetical protein
MKAPEEKRRYWSTVIARFERSGESQARFTTEAGIGVATFRYWLYKFRRERTALATPSKSRGTDEVRLVPVEVRRPIVHARLDLRVADLRVLVPIGTDPRYVAHVAVALREAATW